MFDFLNSLSIRKRFVYGFGIVNIFVLAMGILGIVQLRRINTMNSDILHKYNQAATLPNDAESEYLRIRSYSLALLVSSDPSFIQNRTDKMNEELTKLGTIIATYDSLSSSLDTTAIVLSKDFFTNVEKFKQAHIRAFEMIKSGDSLGARELLLSPTTAKIFDETGSSLAALIKHNKETMQKATQTVEATSNTTQIILLCAMLAMNVLGFVAANAISNSVVPPITSLLRATQKVIAGDLSVQVSVKGQDEIGNLRQNFNSMVESIRLGKEHAEHQQEVFREKTQQDLAKAEAEAKYLEASVMKIRQGLHSLAQGDFSKHLDHDRDDMIMQLCHSYNNTTENISRLINQVLDSVNTTADIANQISSSSTEMAATSHEQSLQVSEIADSIDHMASTIESNSKTATRTAQSATETSNAAKSGETAINKMLAQLQDVEQSSQRTTEKVIDLGASSAKIGEIVSVIYEIADQTNLLALNAAIEAARAGEAGRGFAVVADEVRKLAERTGKATKEIEKMIARIQGETDEVVMLMEDGNSKIKQGVQLSENTGVALKSIIHSILEVQGMVQQIAVASEQQSTGARQITSGASNLSSASQEMSATVSGIAQTSELLSEQTENLRLIVSQFIVAEAQQEKPRQIQSAYSHAHTKPMRRLR